MKGYIYVYDQRSAYLKELFLENGVEIVDSIEDEIIAIFLFIIFLTFEFYEDIVNSKMWNCKNLIF